MINPITCQADDCIVPAAAAERFDAELCPDLWQGEPVDVFEAERRTRSEEAEHPSVSIETYWTAQSVSLRRVEVVDLNCSKRLITFHTPEDAAAKEQRVDLSAHPLDARRVAQEVVDQLDERWHIVQSSDGERTIALNMERFSGCILHNPRNPRKISVKCAQWYALDTRLFRAESLPHIYELMRASVRAYTAGVVKEWRERQLSEEATVPEARGDRKRRSPSSDDAECIGREAKVVCVARAPPDQPGAHPEGGADAGNHRGKQYCPNADDMATEPEKH